MQEQKSRRRLVVVGDVHGQFDPLVKVLRHAGLIDRDSNWAQTHDRLVQMGDVFDRGPHTQEAQALLDKLQKQAPAYGGEVIRLVGNHELEILCSNFLMSGLDGVEAIHIRDRMTEQVLSGELCAAYAHKGFLFTHAGVTNKLYKIFEAQLDDANAHNIAVLTNLIFKESIKHHFFKHPIFNISLSRNGTNKFGGIFWEDLRDLINSFQASPVWQIIGHTQVDHIVIDSAVRLIPVDVGLHRKLQYLVIEDKKPPVVCQVPMD